MGGRGASSGVGGANVIPAAASGILFSGAGGPIPMPSQPQQQQPQQQQNQTVMSFGGGGRFGGHPNLQSLIQAMQQSQSNASSNSYGFHAGEGSSAADFTDNNNPALVKWQNQNDDSKTARYLSKLGKAQTPAQDAEGYTYHQSAFQNMVIDQGLNAPVYAKMDRNSFNAYCKANNLQPFYRGWSGGNASKDRFENAAAFHTGTGMYGEGLYFGDKSTASGYSGGAMTKAALSPNARVVDLSDVQAALSASGASRAFARSGQSTTGYYSKNSGESQMALKMGYNVIRTSWSYVVLSRDAVVIQK